MNVYRNKSVAELQYIMKDASEAAKAMQGHDAKAEAKYLDQVNDAASEMYRRRLPQCRKPAYGVRLINFDLTHWFTTEAEQVAFAKRCGFEYVLC